MKRRISKVSVLGSGVMGSQIACHFANIGVQVLLLDIPAKEGDRNAIVNGALAKATKMKPAPLYDASFLSRISTGNLEDDLDKIADSDWIIEVVIEDLEIKKSLFEKVDIIRTPGTLITSNTSGIPINMMTEGRSEDFQRHFCGTHFFNPPRYLKLFEIIPSAHTAPEVLDFLMQYGDLFLGKNTVLCKDTPAFIANRVGIFAIMDALHRIEKLGLSVDTVDKLTGPLIGRAKSATFRTLDVVGNDTLIKVATFLQQSLPKDEARTTFALPKCLQVIHENKWYGAKSGTGFYKKITNDKGESEILSLDLNTFEHTPKERVNLPILEMTKVMDRLEDRLKACVVDKTIAGQFYRETFFSLFAYVTHRIPEISNELYRIDEAVCAGFGWEKGPFETWDILGVEKSLGYMKEMGVEPASWVQEMLDAGHGQFYKKENNACLYYDVERKTYKVVPGTESLIILDNIDASNVVWENGGATLYDIGDGILNLEFHTKMNTMGSEIIQGIHTAIDKAEKEFDGLVIGNQAENFSAGANLALLLMNAAEQEWEEIDMMIRTFQKTMMRARYSSIPVVVAPHGLSLGGGCELTLHGDRVQAAAETYIGLVEVGVGLIPGGGGTKELTLRAADAYEDGDIELNTLKNAYLNIGMAKVATSAFEAKNLGIIRPQDGISIRKDRQILDAKRVAMNLAAAGYTQPMERTDIKVQGKTGLAMFQIGAESMKAGNYISEHDVKISNKLAWIMCGGDLSQPTKVSEQYLLDLEREAFLSLLGEKKTLERIQHMLKTGKPLRN